MSSSSPQRPVINVLRLTWVFAILFYEYATFFNTVRNCTWPDTELQSPLSAASNKYNNNNKNTTTSRVVAANSATTTTSTSRTRPHHSLLVADPQIVDRWSYPNRVAPLSYLTRFMVDLNLRKNWRAAIAKRPDSVVFLGDFMDNGRLDISDHEYEELSERFKSIFKTKDDIPVFFIPGNHDIGLGNARTFRVSPKAYERYVDNFGAANYETKIANHTLVLFDAPRFVDEDMKRHGQRMSVKGWRPIQGGSWAFLKNFSKQEHTDPTILFSHIPLYRPDGKNCGPLREHGRIRPGAGDGYQNTLEKHSTALLLDVVNPVVVFSGDDHDYCEHTHRVHLGDDDKVRSIREITIRSISMSMNVRRPGFQLLSLAPEDLRQEGKPSYADTPCLLPEQMKIYRERYLPLIGLTLLVILFSAISGVGVVSAAASPQLMFSTPTRDDDDDDDDGSTAESDEESSLSPRTTTTGEPIPSKKSQRSRHHRHHHHRSLRGPRGWVMFQAAATRREPSSSVLFLLQRNMRAYCRKPMVFSMFTIRRRRLLIRCLRDLRDVAIFPIVTFCLVTWWIVVY